MRAHRFNLILVLMVAFVAHFCVAQELSVAAAADLQFAMQDIAGQFEKQTGKMVKPTYGSSGNFFQQIQNGAPFEARGRWLDRARKLL
jgi:molybdate transport system substrate-binding protein